MAVRTGIEYPTPHPFGSSTPRVVVVDEPALALGAGRFVRRSSTGNTPPHCGAPGLRGGQSLVPVGPSPVHLGLAVPRANQPISFGRSGPAAPRTVGQLWPIYG